MADKIPTMTSNTEPSGTTSASTSRSSSYYSWKAMDDDTSTWWSTGTNVESGDSFQAPCWLMYSWSSLTPMIVNSYTIRARSGVGNQDGAPKTFKLQGYNGSIYTDLDTPADQTAWGDGEVRTFNFTNTTAYLGYRLYITDNNGGSYTEIAEFELHGGTSVIRIELSGVTIVCKDPKAEIEVAGVVAICKDPKIQMDLSGVVALWKDAERAGGLWLGFHF